jgi:aspartate-semialdehyde dehydrogenase
MKIAVVGATGLVGREILRVMEEYDMVPEKFIPVASERSVGSKISFRGREYPILPHDEAIAAKPDVAIFSAGAGASKEWAPQYASAGITVIDNSSAWRMEESVPLVVPEINSHVLGKTHRIIANPNCSTIQMVLVLAPLHRKYRIKRLVVSTYQSVTGTGVRAVRQLENERQGIKGEMAYPHLIDMNLFPHGGTFLADGYTSEEEKLVKETRKILEDDSIRVTATVVRVPVMGGHSESVNVEFENEFEPDDVRKLLMASDGIVVQDSPDENLYPMPYYSRGRNEVFVGRIRRDLSQPKSLNLWIVADNLRKGAATNAVQIATCLEKKGLLS